MGSQAGSIILKHANIIDEGRCMGQADIVIKKDRIAAVMPDAGPGEVGDDLLDCSGLTIMSGLCDAHAHLSWIDSADFNSIDSLPVEEHMLRTADNARTYLDAGYTMCVGAAAAKLRLDVAIRNAIDAGQVPGPRYLANGPEISSTGSYIDQLPESRPVAEFGLIADGPDQVRKQVRRLLKQRVDLIKLGLSGEEIVGRPASGQTIMDDDEVEMAVTEAGRMGVRVCAHARSAGAVRLCLDHNVPIIYHASFVDEKSMDELVRRRDEFFVVPSLAFIYRLVEGDGEPFGMPKAVAQHLYQAEVDAAVAAMRRLKREGVRILPGGDYGFAWCPHGTYARDLEYFVDLLDFTPGEALAAATVLGGEIMGRPNDLGRVAPGYLADLILIDSDPISDIKILQERERIVGVMKGGQFFRRPSSQRGEVQGKQ